MISSLNLPLFIIFAGFTLCRSQHCNMITQVDIAIQKWVQALFPGIPGFYSGCLHSFTVGDPSTCDASKFTMPQAPICQDAVRQIDFAPKIKNFNLMKFESLFENAIYSNGADSDELCESLVPEVDKLLTRIKEFLTDVNLAERVVFVTFCKNDPTACKELENLPKQVEDYFLKDLTTNFKDLIKIIKTTAKQKGLPFLAALNKGIELTFGGGEFGIKAAKCANELLLFATKMLKQILGF